MISRLLSLPSRRHARFLIAIALGFSCLAAGRAQSQHRRTQASEKTSEAFGKLKPLVDERDWDGALALLDSLVPAVPTESYDMALILDTKAGILAQKNDLEAAATDWVEFMRINDKFHYYDKQHVDDVLHYLAQIYFQLGASVKIPPGADSAHQHEVQRELFSKAVGYTRRWAGDGVILNQDDEESYANQLYNLAVCNPDKADDALLGMAEREAKKGLRLAIHPRETLYYVLVLIYQQRNDFVKAAEYLELLTKIKPESKAYWPQLASAYVSLAGSSAKDKQLFREYYARAILTIERAQERGVMKAPKENYLLVSLYYGVDQYSHAAELLFAGLKNGGIASTVVNWQLLGYCYVELNDTAKAIEIYQEAEKHLPPSGQFDLYIAQIYSQSDNEEKAYEYFHSATEKDHLPAATAYSAYLNAASAAYQLHRYPEAMAACDAAAKYPQAANDKQLQNFRTGIQDEINRELAAKKAAAEPAGENPS